MSDDLTPDEPPFDPDALVTLEAEGVEVVGEPPPEGFGGSQSAEEEPDSSSAPSDEPKDVTFDERHRVPLEGLLFLGKLSSTFEWLGHSFTVRTLTQGEFLEVAMLHKRFQGTVGDSKAYTVAIVAACLDRVDGQPLAIPPNPNQKPILEDRFDQIQKWFPPTIDRVYEEFLKLDGQMRDVMEAMGNRSG